ncbi:hypothetical protein EVAR_77579_1 [Eumeta japonica]|uniref:Uncharacterized protein n=1 Tax=Eumeta variegata TaxID=151549 RepID=A0A4C1T7J6_EUMVA|nr:hypothetical protein EVAR_77579_1 [Eumeta japonica]
MSAATRGPEITLLPSGYRRRRTSSGFSVGLRLRLCLAELLMQLIVEEPEVQGASSDRVSYPQTCILSPVRPLLLLAAAGPEIYSASPDRIGRVPGKPIVAIQPEV